MESHAYFHRDGRRSYRRVVVSAGGANKVFSRADRPLKDVVRSATDNIFRLMRLHEHTFALGEESITQLFVSQMTGPDYRVESACPQCGTTTCAAWTEGQSAQVIDVLLRPLNKWEEGDAKEGVSADFIMQFEGGGGTRQESLFVQAKVLSSKSALLGLTRQVSILRQAARHRRKVVSGAYALVLIYIDQGTVHAPRAQVKCICGVGGEHETPANLSFVAFPAAAYRHGADVEDLISAHGFPFVCLFGDGHVAPADAIVTMFYNLVAGPDGEHGTPPRTTDGRTLPVITPAVEALAEVPLPRGAVTRVSVVTRTQRPRPASYGGSGRRSGAANVGDETVLAAIIRLNPKFWDYPTWADEPLSPTDVEDVKQATRRFWRMSAARAEEVTHLVPVLGGRVLDVVFRVDEPAVMPAGHDLVGRISFEEAEPETDRGLTALLQRQARERLNGPSGKSSNPVMYIG